MTVQRRLLLALVVVALSTPLRAQRSQLKPGFNLFTVAQDLELGRQLSKELETHVEVLRNPVVVKYLDELCRRLTANAPGAVQFPFQCRLTNDRSINATGLPGGFLYVNRGTIEAAANEAQFASVIAHEIAHVVLRHGTHQISKAYALQVPASALSRAGTTSITAVLSKLEGGFTASSILLKNTTENETEADLLGIQILHAAGYDPEPALQFLQKLQQETNPKTASPTGHPASAARIGNILKEIEKLGGAPPQAVLDSPAYQIVRMLVRG
jgi:predicted Zn-dependent protease